MLNKCKRCGGTLQYDIAKGKLVCEYCDSEFDPAEYETDRTDAKEMQAGQYHSADENNENQQDSIDVKVYTCPNCGAEITATDTEAVEYCMYCGSFVTMASHMEKIQKPDLIIPFSKTREECISTYAASVRKKLYAPKEFRKQEFLQGFKGIYVPYWIYNFTYGPEVKFTGINESRKGDMLYKQHYNIECHVDEGAVNGVSFDASSTFDDTISGKIAPFNYEHMKPYDPSYMFGLFADTADVDADVYEEDADELARDMMWNHVSADAGVQDGYPERPEDNKFDKAFHVRKDRKLAMLPVWFLTWKKGERVAYSVMNGDTGEIYSEIPVDPVRFTGITLLTALVIFALLNMTITFNVSSMLFIAMILSAVTISLHVSEVDKIVRRSLYADDKGYLSVHPEEKQKTDKMSANWLAAAADAVKEIVIEVFKSWGKLSVIILAIGFFSLGDIFVIVAALVMLALPAYMIYRMIRLSKEGNDITIILDMIPAMAALVLSAVILFMDPAGDELYYIAALICMAAIGLSAIRTMLRYNVLITRPVPHFFDREKGGKA